MVVTAEEIAATSVDATNPFQRIEEGVAYFCILHGTQACQRCTCKADDGLAMLMMALQ